MITNDFLDRHNGPRRHELAKMCEVIGVKSVDQLIDETVPASIRLKEPLNLPQGINEFELLNRLKELASKNKIYRTYIGMGYYSSILPGVIQRNILENPGWYTSYTPYQAEISQGRLEALLNFQTMVCDLTGMPLSNSSLLDEGTAAAEAMIMAFNARSRQAVKAGVKKFFVAENVFPQTKAVMETRAFPLGIEIVFGDSSTQVLDETYYGALLQYPDGFGGVEDYRDFVKNAHEKGILIAVAVDLLSLALLTPPGEWGADIVVGSTQRFGLPLGFGGPHNAYLAATEDFKRLIPGRIIGISVDAQGNRALRMALQTREQHIKREKATSNICTAQALMAIMSGFWAIYHGAEGIKQIARHINILAGVISEESAKYGYANRNKNFFDTVTLQLPNGVSSIEIKKLALARKINLRYIDDKTIGISCDETTSLSDVNDVLEVLAVAADKPFTTFVCNPEKCQKIETFSKEFARTSTYLTHEVFNKYHSETEMMRYMKRLENRDLSLNRAMIPLGSCTMKLNAASEMFALSFPEFGAIHPFVPRDQAAGYIEMIRELEKDLAVITGFEATSIQPNSGASGEYAGLLVIQSYHRSRGEGGRNICLIPASAHGTNPASAHMAGMEIVVVAYDANGNIDIADLNAKAKQYKDNLSCLMITYPSTHGVFEESVLDIMNIIHENGGQVYMDGANMNAQVGLTSPGFIGADVCHLNLHKTFASPHGGGGPGIGPICVAKHLVPFLPGNPVVESDRSNTAVSSALYGSALIATIAYSYIKLLGGEGLTEATKMAIFNANYLLKRLEKDYNILYTGTHGRCAHEMIVDCNEFEKTADLPVINLAKRLMDYGFHAPTVAFPVHGTLMVEPTESEPLSELDRFANAMIEIRKEIRDIVDGKSDKINNIIKNAPHTAAMLCVDKWEYPYTRENAAFPKGVVKEDKYFPAVTRIDDAFGDRNLMCSWNQKSDL
ncbi:MAG: aminomethyl-transferring glycine dehydrogenase [Bacteroidales bacterium]|jgi:glycine dehydrogenase|nr:aminomethyl-transferring glycine dehydrogenase [Bacteroidales bacterium]